MPAQGLKQQAALELPGGLHPGALDGGSLGQLREMVPPQGGLAAAEQGPLDGMQQLPDVAGPGQAGQGLGQAGLDGGRRLAGLPRHPRHQPRDQVGEFMPALGQPGQGEHRPLQAVEQVVAEAPRGREGFQGAVGRRQEAHVHPLAAFRPDPLHLPLLEHPQEQRLQARGQIGHFVQEQRAALGAFDGALPVLQRPGEGAADMTEQLGFHEGLGERRAVHRDERAGPPRQAVDLPGRQLLAAARRAVEQDREPGRGDPGQLLQHRGHGLAAVGEDPWGRLGGNHPPTVTRRPPGFKGKS